MMSSFFLILQNTFFAFTFIPFSSGTYYSIGVMFFGNFMPYVAKIFGITLALGVNFLLGFLIRKAFKNKRFPAVSSKILLMSFLTFIPVISGIVSLYFGILKVNFTKFITLSFFINVIYYALAINFPVLNLSF